MGQHTRSVEAQLYGAVKAALENRRVPDPSMSDSEYLHQKAQKPDNPHIGMVWVRSNETTRIGGLALIRRRQSHHERAAEWFKNAFEALYGGIAPAIDMGKVRVDTSIMAHDNGAVARLDNGMTLRQSIAALGKEAADRIIACVVLEIPCKDFAPPGSKGKPSGRAVEREVDALLAALDRLAEIRGFRTRERAA